MVRHVADRVSVMYLGRIVENGPTEAVFDRPNHPYTAALMSAAPKLDSAQRKDRILLKGEVPSPLNPPSGCRFRTRCWKATEICATTAPPSAVDPAVDGHTAECHHPLLSEGSDAGDGMSIWGYCIVAAAIMLASALQASIGFGIGMLAAPIVALVDPALIPGTLIMVADPGHADGRWSREREDIDLHGTGWALVGRVPGTIAGALLLAMLPERGLAIMLALVVLVGVALTSFGWIPVARRRNVVLAGATSGVLGTATSIGGPPMALVWQRKEGARLRGTMSGFFLVGSVMSIVALAATGAVNGHTMVMFAILIPAAVDRLRAVPRPEPCARSETTALVGDRRLSGGRRGADRPRTPGDRRLTCRRPANARLGSWPMSPARRLRHPTSPYAR